MKNYVLLFAAVFSLSLMPFSLSQAQTFYELAMDNPFSPVSLSHFASPTLGDIDGDGDLDLFVGQYNSNEMLFYSNIGTAQDPIFEQQMDDDNPLDLYTSNSGCNAPVLIDIDADYDLDVFVGIWTYIIRYLRNDGDTLIADYTFQSGADNPLNQVMTLGICSYPAFVDIDNDLDMDVFISDGDGIITFYENTGGTTSPVFELDTVNNVLGNIALSGRTKLAFQDVSGDGLIDAVISEDGVEARLRFFVNIGSIGNAVFEERTGSSNPFDGITGTETLVPVFTDIDDDGDRDLVLGTWLGVRLYEAFTTTSIADTKLNNGYRLYPNPAVGSFMVEGEAIREIEIFDQQGRLLQRPFVSGNSTFVNINTEASGIYFVRLISDAGITVQKIILLQP